MDFEVFANDIGDYTTYVYCVKGVGQKFIDKMVGLGIGACTGGDDGGWREVADPELKVNIKKKMEEEKFLPITVDLIPQINDDNWDDILTEFEWEDSDCIFG